MSSEAVWLFVDDDESFLASLLGLFRQWQKETLGRSFLVRSATNVADALMILQDSPVHVLVVDIRMPQIDGVQLLKLVQRKHPHVRKAVLTGFGDPHLRAMAMQSGALEFFTKPIAPDQFELLFRQFMELEEPSLFSPASSAPRQDSVPNRLAEHRSLPVTHPSPGPSTDPGASGGMTGLLPDISLPELVQMLGLSHRNVRLQVQAPAGEGELVIRNGRIHSASFLHLTGPEAAYRILALKGGTFSIVNDNSQDPPNVDRSCESVLMEAAQQMDEAMLLPPPELVDQDQKIQRDFRRITGRISQKHRRKVMIIEEESESTGQWQVESGSAPPSTDPAADTPSSSVWREIIVADRSGRIVFQHGLGEPGLRLDLIEFLTFKSAIVLEKSGRQRVVRIEMDGTHWKALIGLSEPYSFFAISDDPALETSTLLEQLPLHLAQTCTLPQKSPPR
ncbi:MAG: DUF4388 domain-containing protein [Verrucomicrobiia bacterium]